MQEKARKMESISRPETVTNHFRQEIDKIFGKGGPIASINPDEYEQFMNPDKYKNQPNAFQIMQAKPCDEVIFLY